MLKIGLGDGFYIVHPESKEDIQQINSWKADKHLVVRDADLIIHGKPSVDLTKHVVYLFSENYVFDQ